MAQLAQIPFARQISTGKVVTVDEVESGAKCGCECLFCDMPMQARKGSVKHYFAHMPRKVNEKKECDASWQRCVFWMTRLVLQDAKYIWLPSFRTLIGDVEHVITTGLKLPLDGIEFPDNFSDYDNDTAVIFVKGYKLNITVSFKMHPKESPFKASDEGHLSILTQTFQQYKNQSMNFRQMMHKAIIDDKQNRKWLYHPREKVLAFKQRIESRRDYIVNSLRSLQKYYGFMNGFVCKSCQSMCMFERICPYCGGNQLTEETVERHLQFILSNSSQTTEALRQSLEYLSDERYGEE